MVIRGQWFGVVVLVGTLSEVTYMKVLRMMSTSTVTAIKNVDALCNKPNSAMLSCPDSIILLSASISSYNLSLAVTELD